MNSNEIDIHKELKKYFGFSQFKGLQEQVIKSLLNKENTFVIMPTGGGKSLCYQLPALILDGTANCSFSSNCFNEKSSGCHKKLIF